MSVPASIAPTQNPEEPNSLSAAEISPLTAGVPTASCVLGVNNLVTPGLLHYEMYINDLVRRRPDSVTQANRLAH